MTPPYGSQVSQPINLRGSPSAGIGVLGKLFLILALRLVLGLGGKSRRDMILSSALPVLNGGLPLPDLRRSERFNLGDNDLDFTTTSPLFSGRLGHSHTQCFCVDFRVCSRVECMWFGDCKRVECMIGTVSSSLSELDDPLSYQYEINT